jgi:cytochrome c oxidase subunit 1
MKYTTKVAIHSLVNPMSMTRTINHKEIGFMYGYIGYIAGILGYIISMYIRMEINTQGLSILRKVKEVTIYNNWITIHGLIMLFVFIMPIGIGYYGNYLVPILLGTSELSMPRMNGISAWFLIIGVVMFIVSNVFIMKGISCGWTMYPPLSTRDADNANLNVDLSLLVVHVLGLSSTLGSMNFITTSKYYRHIGLIFLNMSIYVYSIVITSVLLLGALPVLGVAVTGLLLDRNLSSTIFDLMGDPILFQHLFWFFGHPEVYVIILPIFGLVSLILTSMNHKEIFGREGMIYCIVSIGIIGYLVWAHHMFVIGMDIDSRSYFSIATSIISIPTSIKIFSYMNTWASGTAFKNSNSNWSFLCFVLCFTFGGFTGLLLSSANLDILLHDTYFVVGHFHTVLSLASIYGLLCAHYFFLPLFFGYTLLESLGFYHTISLLIGAFFVFYPMHLAGLTGMARRVPEYADIFLPFTTIGFHGTLLLLISYTIFNQSLYVYLTNSIHSNKQ